MTPQPPPLVGMASMAMGTYAPEKKKLQVSIERLDNGYVIHLYEPAAVGPAPEEEAGAGKQDSFDQKIDALIEGMPALFRKITEGGEGGEDWKGPENLSKIREAAKALFPGLEGPRMIGRLYSPPRQEELVFETKEKLLAWLATNL